MKLDEFVKLLSEKQSTDKAKEEKIKAKYKELDRKKKLTQEQRIARIEELLGIEEGGDVDG